jgi:hypothetical protein
MEIIKILRLVTGEDIIAYIERYQSEVIVRSPMEVYLKTDPRTGNEVLSLNNWLPFSILKENETVIQVKDILCVLEPSSELNEYYENAVLSVEESVSNKSNTSASNEAEMKSQMLKTFLMNLDPKEFGTIQ